MNKQFKELLLEAKESTKEGVWNPPTQVWANKFAELIVEECCIALRPMLRDMISRGEGVELIKNHFNYSQKP